MKKQTHTKVVESTRSKRLSKLETIEEVQKDIRTLYGEGKKILEKSASSPELYTINSNVKTLEFFVAESKNITHLKKFQVEKFWQSAYTAYESIVGLSK